MKRLLLMASGLLVIAAFPATSAAATHGIIYTDSVKVRAYKMTLVAFPKTAHSGSGLQISFTRGTSMDTQQHYYGFTHGVHVTMAPGGASATVRADLGTWGRIDLRFSAGGGGRSTPGCPGAVLTQHAGTLSGSFRLNSHSSYFGTVRESSFRGFTATATQGINCKPPTPKLSHGTELDVFSEMISAGPPLSATLYDFNVGRDLKGHILEQFLVLEPTVGHKGPVVIHAIDRAKVPASDFTNATDLSSAQAVASGSFMSGSLMFSKSGQPGPNEATGSVSGTIVAHFDGLAPIALPTATTQANLTVS
jgi:hypothetical protein